MTFKEEAERWCLAMAGYYLRQTELFDQLLEFENYPLSERRAHSNQYAREFRKRIITIGGTNFQHANWQQAINHQTELLAKQQQWFNRVHASCIPEVMDIFASLDLTECKRFNPIGLPVLDVKDWVPYVFDRYTFARLSVGGTIWMVYRTPFQLYAEPAIDVNITVNDPSSIKQDVFKKFTLACRIVTFVLHGEDCNVCLYVPHSVDAVVTTTERVIDLNE